MADIYRDWVLYNVGKATKNGQDYQFDWTMLSEYNQLLEQYQQEILKWDFWRKWQTSSWSTSSFNDAENILVKRDWRSRDWTVYHMYAFWLDRQWSYSYFRPYVIHAYKTAWSWFTWQFYISSWQGQRWSSQHLSDWQYQWVDTNFWIRAEYSWDKDINILRWWQWDYIRGNTSVWGQWHQIDWTWTHSNSPTYYYADYDDDYDIVRKFWVADCWIADADLIPQTNYINSLSEDYSRGTYTYTLTLK